MIKIEAASLEDAYAKAAQQLKCSITEIDVEVIQHPSRGMMRKIFKKNAIIVASCKMPSADKPEVPYSPSMPAEVKEQESKKLSDSEAEAKAEQRAGNKEESEEKQETLSGLAPVKALRNETAKAKSFIKEKMSKISSLNETILPQSFVTGQDKEDQPAPIKHYDYAQKSSRVTDSFFEEKPSIEEVAAEVQTRINELFKQICFKIDEIKVSVYDDSTLLIEFGGEDAALLIGKEGYRYKALSYMLFNWINATYQVQLRLEIAEFLKNQEESVGRYLIGVYENIDRDGKAQTKILDGVLVQIALRELRNRYPDKYVAIRSTRDGSKFIIINSYNEY